VLRLISYLDVGVLSLRKQLELLQEKENILLKQTLATAPALQIGMFSYLYRVTNVFDSSCAVADI